jgi:hypothetical protein
MPQTEAAASNRLAVGMTWRAVVFAVARNPDPVRLCFLKALMDNNFLNALG